jgi:NADH dehydrogenase FAD-containing subunit
MLKAVETQRSKQKHDEPLSSLAFKFNWCRYIKELLTFVVIGAGPTGVELSAELYDMAGLGPTLFAHRDLRPS